MGKRILSTGGAGFVGSLPADELLRGGHRIRRATGPCRMGDIRHCLWDITHARQVLQCEVDAASAALHARRLAA